MNKITKIVISMALAIPLLGVMSSASAGDTAAKRENAGFFCGPAVSAG